MPERTESLLADICKGEGHMRDAAKKMIFLLTAPQFYRGAAAGEYRRMGKNTARLWARAKIKSLSEETGSCLMEK